MLRRLTHQTIDHMIHKGSCLCGKVRYEIHGDLTGVLNCHCSDCRKAHGAAFRTRATVQSKEFIWVSGEELVSHYEAAPSEFRTFCSLCGANLVTKFKNKPEVYGFALGTLDTDPGVKPQCHVFVSDKAPWHDITDGLPQYAEYPPKNQSA